MQYFFLLCFWQKNPFLIIFLLFKMMTKIDFNVVDVLYDQDHF